MAKTKQTFNKRQKEVARLKHREDKKERKAERQANSSGGGLENMMAWVDADGKLTNVPQPLKREPTKE